MDEKQTYTTPELHDWGSVVDLTQVGVTTPGNDALLQGSVYPRGLDK